MMLNRYTARDMTYFLGGLDVCNSQFQCGCNDTNMDETCSGDAEGWCRQQRGFGYYNYLKQLNTPVFNHQVSHLPNRSSSNLICVQVHVVPNVGHDGCGMFTSATVRTQLWDPLGADLPPLMDRLSQAFITDKKDATKEEEKSTKIQ